MPSKKRGRAATQFGKGQSGNKGNPGNPGSGSKVSPRHSGMFTTGNRKNGKSQEDTTARSDTESQRSGDGTDRASSAAGGAPSGRGQERACSPTSTGDNKHAHTERGRGVGADGRPTPGGTGGDGAAEKPVHWTETRNLVCEACEERPNTSVAFSCYSCNLVLCTKCAVAPAPPHRAPLAACRCPGRVGVGIGRGPQRTRPPSLRARRGRQRIGERGSDGSVGGGVGVGWVGAGARVGRRAGRHRAGAARRAARAPRGAVPERPHVPLTREPARTRCTHAGSTRLPPRPRVADGNLPWSPNVTRPRPRPPAGGRSGRVHAPFLHSPTTTSDIHTSDIPSIYSVV